MNSSFVLVQGDVVVVPEVRNSQLVYVLHVEGGEDQFVYHARADAIARAISYARHEGVDAWYGDRAELGFVPLSRSRAPDASGR